MGRKVLPILSCEAGGVLKLDKGAAMAIVNGKEIQGKHLQIKVEYYETDAQGNLIQMVGGNGSIGSIILTIDKAFRSIEIGYIAGG